MANKIGRRKFLGLLGVGAIAVPAAKVLGPPSKLKPIEQTELKNWYPEETKICCKPQPSLSQPPVCFVGASGAC